MSPDRQTSASDLSLIAQTIRRRLWVVAACLVVAALGAIVLTLRAEKEYASTAALLLRPSSAFEPQRVVETNLQLLSLPALATRTADEMPELTPTEVEDSVSASQQGQSDIIQVTATTADPGESAAIANTFAEQFIDFRGNRSSGELEGEVQLVERAVPETNPVSPKPIRNITFGAVIGLALGIGLALILEQFDRRVKRKEDLPEVTGMPLIASVPKRKSFDSEHFGTGSLSPAEVETFLMLRANLRYFNARRDIRSLLVTSAQAGEGKTLVSLGLTLGAAISGDRVLLIEADMRDPSVGRALGTAGAPGLSWVLNDHSAKFSDAVLSFDTRDLASFAASGKLDVLPAGAIPPNPTELVQSPRMKELLRGAEEEYDLVVVDAPPILVVADAIPLVASVSGVLAVSGLGVSTRSSANDLAEQLERMNAPTLGLVANFATDSDRSYDGYGYGRPPETLMRVENPPQVTR